MAFTQDDIKSINSPNLTSTPAKPSFDPNGFTMQTLTSPQNKNPSYLDTLKSNLTQEGTDMGTDITKGSQDIKGGVQQGGIKGFGTVLKGLFEAGPETAWDSAKASFEPVTSAITTASNAIGNTQTAQKIANAPVVGSVLDTINQKEQALNQWSQAHPDASKALGTVLGLGGIAVGESEPVQNAVSNLASKVTEPLSGMSDAFKNIKSEPSIADTTQRSIDAVTPNETGKALQKSYEKVATGDRTANRTGALQTQELTPAENTQKLGTRLKDVFTSDDPLGQLKDVNKALNDTETKISNFKDTTTGTNKELSKTLDGLKKSIPEEYKGIKESKSTYNRVVDFAKKTVLEGDETTQGFRESRSSFDAQAKKEFPSAYKNGSIDTATPAGRAIKLVRDTINKYTYENSSNGAEFQGHIDRQADLFRAGQIIAKKASDLHGSNIVGRFLDEHPVLKAGVGFSRGVARRASAGAIIRGVRDVIGGLAK